jgi:branched-chain amino acid transport system ATP-binding protein
MPLLEATGLTKRFGGVIAVNDFSMQIDRGEIVGLIGPNGAGKTTVFNLLTRITQPDEGTVSFLGADTARMQPFEITRQGMSRTFQNIRLFSGLNVIENVKVALGHSETSYGLLATLVRTPLVKRQEQSLETHARDLLELLDLSDFLYENPEGLPYGLQRRLEIARALANNPRLLLLDEPAAGLNPSEVNGMVELIRRINQQMHLTVLLIEHHMEVVMPICSRIYVLNFGKTIAVGSPVEVQANPLVLSAYLGEEH